MTTFTRRDGKIPAIGPDFEMDNTRDLECDACGAQLVTVNGLPECLKCDSPLQEPASLGDILGHIDVDIARGNISDSVHHIPQPLTPIPAPLPQAVQRFCASINSNFEITATNAVKTAVALETAAQELRDYAEQLRGVAPDISTSVERWIRYEREADAREKFLRTLFVGKGG